MEQQYYSRENWLLVNDKLKTALNFKQQELGLYTYKDLHSALLETLLSFSRQYMIKKKIYYFNGLSPYFQKCLELLSAMSFELHELDFERGSNDFSWIDNLDHTAMAVLMARDVPFLGEIFNWSELQKKLAEKRVLQIELFHNYHFVHGIHADLNPFQICIYDFVGKCALSFFGKRALHEAVFNSGMYWDEFKIEDVINLVSSRSENKEEVLKFEAQLPPGSWQIEKSKTRLYDRAVFSYSDIDASALISLLLEDNKTLNASQLQTPSLTTWGGIKTMDWLLPKTLSKEIVRGMMVIDAEVLSPPLAKSVETQLARIRQLQNG